MEGHALLGDCVKLFPEHTAPESVNMIFADPPYNIGQEYEAYEDNKTREAFIEWSIDWMEQAYKALHPHGTMWLMIGDGFASELDVAAKEFGLHKKDDVIWHYTFGQHSSRGLAKSHVHIFRYTKHKTKWTFNTKDPRVRVPSARQLVYNDKRANPKGKPPADVWVLLPEQLPEAFDPFSNTWLFSRVCGTFKEKEEGMPNQLPLALLERIVLLTSNEGDLVCDPFIGTGTTAEACAIYGRNFVGFDLSQTCVDVTRKRIEQGKEKQARIARLETEQGKLFEDNK
jgi:site-specific DNA-methyltransferase (adenine-specific)